ncbi:hypothetical protein BJF90_38940 [Pseudonocardia sp. CNS-004]|nr:hypothetical protein BJF90_38940 [Pseudonocardia sp. CNS-004]
MSGTTERGEVRFLDTTFRDGSQSLWAMGIRHGMMEALGGDLDRAGFDVIEVPANPIFFKKMVRDLKEDPWETMRMLARTITRTPKTCMGGAGGSLNGFGTPPPPCSTGCTRGASPRSGCSTGPSSWPTPATRSPGCSRRPSRSPVSWV